MRLTQILMMIMVTFLFSHLEAWAQVKGQGDSTSTYSLPQIVDLALKYHPLMSMRKSDVENQKGRHLMAQAYPNPDLILRAGYGTVLDPSNGISIVERYITVTQPIEWPAKRSARQRAAQAGVEGAEAGLEEALVNLKAKVKQSFYSLLLAFTRKKLTTHSLEIVQQLGKAVTSRVEAGDSPPFERVKIQVEILKVRKKIREVEGEIHTAKENLNIMTGEKLGDQYHIQGNFVKMPNNLRSDLLYPMAIKHNPSLLRLRKAVEDAAQRHIQERQARVPDVVIAGSYERDAGRESYLGGLRVPLPLWSQRQGEIAQAMGTRRHSEAVLLKTQQLLKKELVSYFQKTKVAQAQIHTFEKGLLKEAREAVRIAQVSFQYGEATLLDVLDAQRVLQQVLVDYAEARFDLSSALAELERLSGRDLETM